MFTEGYMWEWMRDNDECMAYVNDKPKLFEKLKEYEALTFITNDH